MLYFIENKFGQLTQVIGDHQVNTAVAQGDARKLCRWDFRSLVDAEVMAEKASKLTGKAHIAVDSGPWNSPRYDVIACPTVGEEVSRYFNGDGYPAGKIASISKTLKKITTTDGTEFYRVRNSGTWLNHGTWSMVAGVVKCQNPSF